MRLSGTYQLPWGIIVCARRSPRRAATTSSAKCRSATRTTRNVAIRIEPQAGRYEWTKIWDNRISKRFKTLGNQSLEGEFNLYNTLNINTITAQTNRIGVDLPAADGDHRRARVHGWA